MAKTETWFEQDLLNPVVVRNVGSIFSQDSLGNLIGVRVKKNGDDFTLSGSVNGYCILADGSTVPVIGTRSGNTASIILPASAYSVTGPIAIAIKLTDGNAITTLAACVGIVTRSRTGAQIDPGQTVTDWTNQIAAALQEVIDTSAAQDVKINDLKSAIGAFSVLYDNKEICDPTLSIGFYNSSGNWSNSSRYCSNKVLLRFPSGLNLRSTTTIQDVDVVIYEFKYVDGSLTRNRYVGSGSDTEIVLENTDADCLYSFALHLTAGFTEVPSTGYEFSAFSAKIETLSTDVEGLKEFDTKTVALKGNLTDGNLNNATAPGMYWHGTSSSVVVTNQPPSELSTGGFSLIVFKSSTSNASILQFYQRYNTNNLYYRIATASGFMDWQKVQGPEELKVAMDAMSVLYNNKYVVTPEITTGFYNSSGNWSSSSLYCSNRNLLRFPSGLNLKNVVSISGVDAHINELQYVNGALTRVRHVGSFSDTEVVLENTKSDCFYSFSIHDPNGFSNVPATGYEFYAYSAELQKADTNDTTGTYAYTASTKTLVITGKKMRYTVLRQIDASKNLDSWRLYKGEVLMNGVWNTLWDGQDAEGPIKIDDEQDFISGFHGDEIMTDFSILIDGEELDASVDATGDFSNILLRQTSTCYRDASSSEAFTRYKKVSFCDNEYSCQQRWVSLISCTINRGALALMQIPNAYIAGWDTDRFLPLQVQPFSAKSFDSDTRIGNVYLTDGTLVSLVAEQGQESLGYTPHLVHFSSQNRIKFYFDMYDGQTISPGDELVSKFAFRVNDFL